MYAGPLVEGATAPDRRLSSSGRRTGATRGGGGDAGTEKPTIDEVGKELETFEVEDVPPAGRRSEAHDFLGAVGAGAGTGAGVDACSLEGGKTNVKASDSPSPSAAADSGPKDTPTTLGCETGKSLPLLEAGDLDAALL